MRAPWFLLLAGCTFAPGGGFATLHEATVEVVLEPGAARDLGEGAVLTNLGYRVALHEATLGVERFELQELQGGSGRFDPSDPPPGYTLCHAGHCHHESGAVVDYADIEAELAGDQARFEPVVTLPLGQRVDLLTGEVLMPEIADPWLPRARITKGVAWLGRLVIEATVTPHVGEGEPIDLSISLRVDEPLESGGEWIIDRTGPDDLVLDARLVVDGTLFDHLDFASLAEDGEVHIAHPADPGAGHLTLNLLDSRLHVALTETH